MNNNSTKICNGCGREFTPEEGVQWGSYFYCDDCFKMYKCNVDSYHSPSISTSLKKLRNEEDEKLFIGIELEVTKEARGCYESTDHKEAVFHIRKNYKELGLNFERDSSIGNGFEIVTQPMTYNYIKSNQDKFKSIFEYLTSKGYYSHNKGKCGLHIHISKEALGNSEEQIQQTIEKIMLFVETYRNNVEIFSRRKHQQFSQYNAYTIPYHKQFGDNSVITNEDYYKSGKMLYEINKSDCIGHSSVVNTDTSTGVTIEFRMFRGTLKYETFMATIEFVYNLVNVCKENMTSKISWNKVINYGGDFIKDYVDSLNIIDSNMYLRDYTKQIEDTIKKVNDSNVKIIDNYKKDLSDIETAMIGLLNESINFNDNITQINDLLSFRKNIYSTLQDILVDDPCNNNDVSLFRKLKTLNTDYSKTCVTNLTKLKDTLETYTCYRNLTQDTKEVAKNTIEVIDNIINRIKSEEIEY